MTATRRILTYALAHPQEFRDVGGSNEEAAHVLEKARWPGGVRCPRCGGDEWSWQGQKERVRVCKPCGDRKFSVRIGCWLEGRKASLHKEITGLAYLAEHRSFDGMAVHLRGRARMTDAAAEKLVEALRAAVFEAGLEVEPVVRQEPQEAPREPVAGPVGVERRGGRWWALAAAGAVLVLGLVWARQGDEKPVQAMGPMMIFEAVDSGLSVGVPANMDGERSAAVEAAIQALKEL